MCAILGAMLVALGGCGEQPAINLSELDLAPTYHEVEEFTLGRFIIPIPIVERRDDDKLLRYNRLEFGFELHALISPSYRSNLTDAWKRHEGKVRDRVISVCRSASLADLQEPELVTLKSHLADAVQAELGTTEVRRLLMTDIVTQEL